MKLNKISGQTAYQFQRLSTRLNDDDPSRSFIDGVQQKITELESGIEAVLSETKARLDSVDSDPTLSGDGRVIKKQEILNKSKPIVDQELNKYAKQFNDRFDHLSSLRTLKQFAPEDRAAGHLATQEIRANLKSRMLDDKPTTNKQYVSRIYKEAAESGNLAALDAIEQSNKYLSDLLPQSEIDTLREWRLEQENPAQSLQMRAVEIALNNLRSLDSRLSDEFKRFGYGADIEALKQKANLDPMMPDPRRKRRTMRNPKGV